MVKDRFNILRRGNRYEKAGMYSDAVSRVGREADWVD